MDTALSFLIGLMRRQFRFVAAICVIFMLGLFYIDGLTTANVIYAIIFTLVIGLFGLLVYFWTAIFKSVMTKRR